MFDVIVSVIALVLAELVTVMPPLSVKVPAPARMELFAVALVKVSEPTVMVLFTVVLPAAEKVALSPAVQVTALEPFHQVLPPDQFPVPPAVALPALLQVTFAALAVVMLCSKTPAQKSASTPARVARKRLGEEAWRNSFKGLEVIPTNNATI